MNVLPWTSPSEWKIRSGFFPLSAWLQHDREDELWNQILQFCIHEGHHNGDAGRRRLLAYGAEWTTGVPLRDSWVFSHLTRLSVLRGGCCTYIGRGVCSPLTTISLVASRGQPLPPGSFFMGWYSTLKVRLLWDEIQSSVLASYSLTVAGKILYFMCYFHGGLLLRHLFFCCRFYLSFLENHVWFF